MYKLARAIRFAATIHSRIADILDAAADTIDSNAPAWAALDKAVAA